MTGQEEGDLSMQVTVWAGLTLYIVLHNISVRDDCCLTSVEQFISYVTMTTKYFLKETRMMSVFVLDKYTVGFDIVSYLK